MKSFFLAVKKEEEEKEEKKNLKDVQKMIKLMVDG